MKAKILVVSGAVGALAVAGCGGTSPSSSTSTPTGTASSSVVPAPSGTAGEQLWVQHFTVEGEPAEPGAVVVSDDAGTVFVTGSAGTVAYNASTGAQRWSAPSKVFFGSGGSTPAPTAAVSPDGRRLFVSGPSGNPSDYTTFGYDAVTGKQLWSSRYDGPAKADDAAHAVAVSPDSAVVLVTGMSKGSSSRTDIATVAYDAGTGTQRWVARYPGPGTGELDTFAAALPAPQSLAVSPDGATVYVAGTSRGATTGLDYATIAYNATNGEQRWAGRYHSSEDGAGAVTVSPRGDTVFTTGSSQSSTGIDMVTVAYSAASGVQRWVSRYNGPANGNEGGGRMVVTSAGDRLVVTGISETKPEGVDYATVGYNATTGAQSWVQRYRCVTGGTPAGLGLSPDGAYVYVTCGSPTTGTGPDYATISYDTATGQQHWVMRYRGGETRALTVGRNGTIYVTGSTGDAYTTIAYHG